MLRWLLEPLAFTQPWRFISSAMIIRPMMLTKNTDGDKMCKNVPCIFNVDIERPWPRQVTVDTRQLKVWWLVGVRGSAFATWDTRLSRGRPPGAAPAPRRWAECCQRNSLGLGAVVRGAPLAAGDTLGPVDSKCSGAEAVAVKCIEPAAGGG